MMQHEDRGVCVMFIIMLTTGAFSPLLEPIRTDLLEAIFSEVLTSTSFPQTVCLRQ